MKESIRSRALRAFPLGAVLCTALTAQAPGAWATLQPTVGITFNQVHTSERLWVARNGNYLRAFSAFTGQWHAFTPSFGTSIQLTDDILLIPESDRWTAFST